MPVLGIWDMVAGTSLVARHERVLTEPARPASITSSSQNDPRQSCDLHKDMLESQTPEPQHVTLFGNRVSTEILIKFK